MLDFDPSCVKGTKLLSEGDHNLFGKNNISSVYEGNGWGELSDPLGQGEWPSTSLFFVIVS